MRGEGGGGGDQPHVAQGGGQGDQVPHGKSGSENRTNMKPNEILIHQFHFALSLSHLTDYLAHISQKKNP